MVCFNDIPFSEWPNSKTHQQTDLEIGGFNFVGCGYDNKSFNYQY